MTVGFKNGSWSDPVTSADLASERAIRAVIETHRRDDAILAEESGRRSGTSGLCWIIDPLDGTVNFARGLDRYAISIAVESTDDGRTVAAAVLQPATARWLALDADGIVASPARTGVNQNVEASRQLLAFAVPHGPAARGEAYRALAHLAARVQDLRNSGSTVCDLAAVATGELDGFVTFNPAPWDIAAGLAIVRAAGGRSRRWTGRGGLDVVVAGSDRVLETVADALRHAG